MKVSEYKSFDGICLTDTFQLGETDASTKLFSDMFPQNSKRVDQQRNAPLRVIIGNPPYSIGQKDENDNAQNQEYILLDKSIANTYVDDSNFSMSKSNYDSYIKAFRWASDRLGEDGGVISFITNSGWIDKNSLDGFRSTISKEFSKIIVINLKGGIRGLSGDLAKRQGKNVFNIMTGVAISVLVKKKSEKNTIQYYEVDDYLDKKEKLNFLNKNKSKVFDLDFKIISPNKENDWLNQRNDVFSTLFGLYSKEKTERKIFNLISNGIVSSRDTWVYNFSSENLILNVKNMISFYHDHVIRLGDKTNIDINKFINTDSKKISWSRAFKRSS